MAVSTNPVIGALVEAITTVAEVTTTVAGEVTTSATARTTSVVVIGTLALVATTVVATRLGTLEQQIAAAGKVTDASNMLPWQG
jgi:hypothetical protein